MLDSFAKDRRNILPSVSCRYDTDVFSVQIYLHRVLKEIHPDISVSQKAISVLDSFTKDMHDRIAQEAGDLCRRHNKATLSSREVIIL